MSYVGCFGKESTESDIMSFCRIELMGRVSLSAR